MTQEVARRRLQIIRKHLDEYEEAGRKIQAELGDISFQRNRITENTAIRLVFGGVAASAAFAPEYWEAGADYPDQARPIVLHQPGGRGPTHIMTPRGSTPIAGQMVQASEIAYPGLQACLLAWLDQREAHARAELAAWEARDAPAEAMALLSG